MIQHYLYKDRHGLEYQLSANDFSQAIEKLRRQYPAAEERDLKVFENSQWTWCKK